VTVYCRSRLAGTKPDFSQSGDGRGLAPECH